MVMEYKKIRVRRKEILERACDVASSKHYRSISRQELAELGETVPGNVSRIMGSMEGFRDLIVDYAIKNNKSHVVGQAIQEGHSLTQSMSGKEKKKHLLAIL